MRLTESLTALHIPNICVDRIMIFNDFIKSNMTFCYFWPIGKPECNHLSDLCVELRLKLVIWSLACDAR